MTVRELIEIRLTQEERDNFYEELEVVNKLEYLDTEVDNLYDAINEAFNWEDTPQGHYYWEQIAESEMYYPPVLVTEPVDIEGKIHIKAFVTQNDHSYLKWLNSSEKYYFTSTKDLVEAQMIVFTGGEDVSPELYNETPHKTVSSDFNRDEKEVFLFQEASNRNLPLIGICRGAQFLCVMAGGKLVQHMSHPPSHYISDIDGNKIKVTSSHHQMQLPPKNASILGFCSIANSGYVNETTKIEIDLDIENVYYPEINALGIQSHPEWQTPSENKYFVNLVEDFLEKKNYFEEGRIITKEEALKKYEEIKFDGSTEPTKKEDSVYRYATIAELTKQFKEEGWK
jgi:gamma-glutamyl-gamma-aminobutyrate hydrolase PuuD